MINKIKCLCVFTIDDNFNKFKVHLRYRYRIAK